MPQLPSHPSLTPAPLRPSAESPDEGVNPWLGEFTDRQMAQLRSMIEESFRAVLRSELAPGSQGCHQGISQEVAKQEGGLSPIAAPSQQEYGIIDSRSSWEVCDFSPSAVDGGRNTPVESPRRSDLSPSTSRNVASRWSTTSGSTSERRTRRAATQQSLHHEMTKKMVHELTGVEDSMTSPMRSLLLTSRHRLHRIAFHLIHRNHYLECAVGILIVANSVVIGIETQFRLDNVDEKPAYLFWLESLFLVCFAAELIVRWLSDGTENLSSRLFWFDLSLLVTGVIYTWIVDPILVARSQKVPLLSQVLTLRVFRLMRLIRALGLMEQFKELWKLCSGLLRSSRTMLSVCILVLLAVFVFACLAVDLISTSPKLKRNATTQAIVEAHFSSLMVTLLTLMQFANADSIGSIYLPLCKEEPALVLYFLVLWLVVTVALMNLVTAIIVENAMAAGRLDAEQKQNHLRRLLKKILPDIEEVFDKLDVDRSNSLDLAELQEATRQGKLVLPEEVKDYVDPYKLVEIFDLLDTDKSGTIERSEFFDGICSLVVSSVPLETTQTLQMLRRSLEVLLDTQTKITMLVGGGLEGSTSPPMRGVTPEVDRL